MAGIFTFPNVKGMTTNNLLTTSNLCSMLKNFIIDENGIYMRKGTHKVYEGDKRGVIVSYEKAHVFLFLIPETEQIVEIDYRTNTSNVVDVKIPNKSILSFVETNNRVLVFFDGIPPKAIYKDENDKYTCTDLNLEGEGVNTSFTGGVNYANRMFYYKENDSKVYYVSALSYQGNLNVYNTADIFGVVGRLKKLFTMGFTAGYGATSYLGALYDTGDVLIFQGLSPDDPSSWSVKLKLKLNEFIYGNVANVSNSACILTGKGIIDLTTVMATNSADISNAILSNELVNSYDGTAKDSFWKDYNLCPFGNFLFIYNTHADSHYLFNFRTGGFTMLQGWKIQTLARIADILYFSDGTNVYQAFIGNSDDGSPIQAEYITNFYDFGVPKIKKTKRLKLNLKRNGYFDTYVNFHGDGTIDKKTKTPLELRYNNPQPTWNNLNTWADVNSLLWAGASGDRFVNALSIPWTIGTTLALRIVVNSLDTNINPAAVVSEFVINSITVEFETRGF